MFTRSLLAASFLAAIAAVGCAVPPGHNSPPGRFNLPPAQQLLEPGPGVGGPGPGVLPPLFPQGPMAAPPAPRVQVLFSKPEGMQIRWDVSQIGAFDSEPLITPGRQDFPQGGIYRLKLTNIEGQLGVELYPTLEVAPTTPRSAAYLAHNAIPIQVTDEDFDQVLTGNFVTKVIYLPDPEFQELALAGVDTLVSTRLDPGVDPIVEADRRGAILAILRIGNKDLETPGALGGAEEISTVGYEYGPDGQPVSGPPGVPYGVPYGAPYSGPLPQGPPGMSYGPALGEPYAMHGVVHQLPAMPNYVAGVTAPSWGMPITGTPIGLPGPPHIPLGGPAGLQKHVMRNHTRMHIPGPTEKLRFHVQQSPGLSYPQPANRVFVRERTVGPVMGNRQPGSDMRHVLGGGGMGGGYGDPYCPPTGP